MSYIHFNLPGEKARLESIIEHFNPPPPPPCPGFTDVDGQIKTWGWDNGSQAVTYVSLQMQTLKRSIFSTAASPNADVDVVSNLFLEAKKQALEWVLHQSFGYTQKDGAISMLQFAHDPEWINVYEACSFSK